jgi:hypothetical protein
LTLFSKQKSKKSTQCRSWVLCFALCFVFSVPCWAEMAVIPMEWGRAKEVLPVVRDLLSEEGRATADSRTNALLIIDTPESIQRIQSFLESYDKPIAQARVRVRFQETSSSRGYSISGDVRASGDKWEVTTGTQKKDGVEVRVGERDRHGQRDSEFFIHAASGNWAYIMVGEDVLYNGRWIDLCRRYGSLWGAPVVERIETGFEVRPILLQDVAQVDIMPRISRRDPDAKREVIRFSSAATSMAVPYNQWVTIGGTGASGHEVMREILGRGRAQKATSLTMSLMVEGPP